MDGSTGDMGAAVEAAFSAASTPDAASADTSASTPASATVTPESASQGATATPESAPGPVPYERFKERNEAANRYEQELKELGWAKSIKREHAQSMADFYTRLNANPLTLLEEAETLREHPVYGGALKSWAARMLGHRQAQTDPDPEPQADIQLEDGRRVFSEDGWKQREAWLTRKMQQQFDERLQPLVQSEQRRAGQEKVVQIQQEAKAQGVAQVQAMRQKPFFTEHESDIKAAMLADENLSLQDAYLKVLTETVIPKAGLQKSASMQQKVAASSANPSRPGGAAAGQPKSFRDGLIAAFGAS